MAEPCPHRTSLRAFAAGTLSDAETRATEDHLATCLDCARQLDTITREQLAELGPVPRAAVSEPASPLLVKLMETAVEGFSSSSRRSAEDAVLAAFDPPQREGSPGRFAGYDVLEIAGSGGMGVVLKAHDPTLHRDVALKILSPNRAWNDTDAERFLHEARTIASLQHDHVVAIFSAGREKGLPYLVMPFHAEGTLERQLQLTPTLAANDVARIGLQLAHALEATHAKGILHRDIKPSNVLLEGGLERVRLADFGLAEPVRTDDTGRTKTIAGTPHYMSPEQARGEAIDARSDLFGLGALLYQLSTGRPLYDGADAANVLAQASRGEAKSVRVINAALPRALANIIDRMIAPRPKDRFASAREVVEALDRLANRAGRRSRLLRKLVVSALAACLIVSATILLLDLSGRTAIINSLLCQRTGDTYYLRGRFGTFSRLPEAVAAGRPHDVIEARFSNEQVIDSFRIGGKPLTIRAAPGFTPILVATNNAQPFILADAPLTLEGLTLWRRTPRVNNTALISVEKAPLFLLNCRIARSRFQGQDVLVWGRLRTVALNEAQPQQLFRALVAFQQGSEGFIENCVFATTQAAAIGLRASTNEPARLTFENNLIVADRTVFMRPEAVTSANLRFSRNAIVTAGLLELDETEPVRGLSLAFDDCVIDHTGGALLRVNQGHGGELVAALQWTETNVLYAGGGSYVMNRRRRQLDSEDQWNEWVRLDSSNHKLVSRQIFPETTVRSALTLNASDLNVEALQLRTGVRFEFNAGIVGEGKTYEAFRRSADYRKWRSAVRARTTEWERQTAPRRANTPSVAEER
ncbi:MAG: protein kinase [Verrucomicrobia bacterium]|nr:protein kinase [Verrucomicrobiota bacterium]